MTPNDPEFWPPSMTRDGDTATREHMVRAWRRWWSSESGRPRVASRLAFNLIFAGANVGRREIYRCDRLADAMLQRARKAGHIHYDGRQWQEGPGE